MSVQNKVYLCNVFHQTGGKASRFQAITVAVSTSRIFFILMMTLKQAVTAIQQYFRLEELVSKIVFLRYGVQAWTFFDPRALETFYVIRKDILGVPLVCNNWLSGGSYQERGLRTIMDTMLRSKVAEYLGKQGKCRTDKEREQLMIDLLYIPAHSLGNGFDFSSGKMSADDIRKKIVANKDKLPYPIRLEYPKNGKSMGWCHFDMENMTDDKIQIFYA